MRGLVALPWHVPERQDTTLSRRVSIRAAPPRVLPAQSRREWSVEAANDYDSVGPVNVVRLEDAMVAYADKRALSNKDSAKEQKDRGAAVKGLVLYLKERKGLQFVHEVRAEHFDSYVMDLHKQQGRRLGSDGKPMRLTSKTIEKRMLYDIDWIRYCANNLRATRSLDSIEKLAIQYRREARRAADRDTWHYLPFENRHLQEIFAPASFLAHTRQPDFFWAPLLALHLGIRPGEVVRLPRDAFSLDPESGIWFVDIPTECAKTESSVRRRPITERMVYLGFIEYLKHLDSLGASQLFPHRDYTGKALTRDPSKFCSRNFSQLLGRCGIDGPYYVLYSFRHTVITAFSDAKIPLADVMMLTGHQAQDTAVRKREITKSQAGSLHLTTYTHANVPRMNVDDVLLRFKRHFECAVKPPIDYPRLRAAAEIVRQHLRRGGDSFVAGCAAQNGKYTQRQIERTNQSALEWTGAARSFE